MTQGLAFLAIGAATLGLCTLAFLGIGIVRLDSRLGVLRDGLAIGARAPLSALESIAAPQETERWLLLLFADHSLREFPSVVDGIRELANEPALEIVMLSRPDPAIVQFFVDAMDIPVRVVHVDDRVYQEFNVRVMPFVQLVDPNRIVREGGLVNRSTTLVQMWRVASLDQRSAHLNSSMLIADQAPS
jgi:hypothetical protein